MTRPTLSGSPSGNLAVLALPTVLALSFLTLSCGRALTAQKGQNQAEIKRNSLVNKGKMIENACDQLTRMRDHTSLTLNAATSWKNGTWTPGEALQTMLSTNNKIHDYLGLMLNSTVSSSSETDLEETKALHLKASRSYTDCGSFIELTLKPSVKLGDSEYNLLQNACVTPYEELYQAHCKGVSDDKCAMRGTADANRWVDDLDFLDPSAKCSDLPGPKKQYDDLFTPSESNWSCDTAYNEALRAVASPALKKIFAECRAMPAPTPTPVVTVAPAPVPTAAPVAELTEWQKRNEIYISEDGWQVHCNRSNTIFIGRVWGKYSIAEEFSRSTADTQIVEKCDATEMIFKGIGTIARDEPNYSSTTCGKIEMQINRKIGAGFVRFTREYNDNFCFRDSENHDNFWVELRRAKQSDFENFYSIGEIDLQPNYKVTAEELNCREVADVSGTKVWLLKRNQEIRFVRAFYRSNGETWGMVDLIDGQKFEGVEDNGEKYLSCYIRLDRHFLTPILN